MPMILRPQDYEEEPSSAPSAVDMTTSSPTLQTELSATATTLQKFDEDTFRPLQMTQDDLTRKARAGPKRKPEKSRIIRVRKSEDGNNLKCSYCLTEVLSYEDLQQHEQFCRRSPMNISPRDSPEAHQESLSGYRPSSVATPPESMSPEPMSPKHITERPGSKDNITEGGCTQVLKLLQEAVPHMNGSQQMALEMILNAQMSLTRMALNAKEKDSSSGALPLEPQQLLQLQLIQLLQAQLTMNNNNNNSKQNVDSSRCSISDEKVDDPRRSPPRRFPSKSPPVSQHLSKDVSMSPAPKDTIEDYRFSETGSGSSPSEEEPSGKEKSSNISSLVIQHSDSPPPSGLNTLEMLQKTADEVLNNASKGLLASRLIDSCSEADNKDPEARHRCKYCAKIFNSDSALQIHIRSHTGERPFKCNICGNRFTTKGNLKVHFQRHSDRFPHIKMNGHPVPEHLDKFYPPLLQQMGELGDNASQQPDGLPGQGPPPTSLSSNGPFPLSPSSSMSQALKNLENQSLNLKNLESTLFKSAQEPLAKSLGKEKEGRLFDFRLFPQVLGEHMKEKEAMPPLGIDKSVPDEKRPDDYEMNLSFNNSVKEETMEESEPEYSKKENTSKAKNKSFQNHTIESLLLSRRQEISEEDLGDARNIYKNILELKENLNQGYGESPFDVSKDRENSPKRNTRPNSPFQEQESQRKEDENYNASNRDDVDQYMSDCSSDGKDLSPRSKSSSTPTTSPIEFSHIPFLGMPLPPNLPLFQGLSNPFPNPSHVLPGAGLVPHPPVDPARNPTLYNNLLPRPGSTDNSWEALIEVDKASENVKVDQILGKSRATEPNQCAICQRVLSCKSALHMHYRTHTGERPFKCRICGRAFTTKGNLKTHMSVHRAKPPMRMFHQCSVCHKKFSNGLILQQHIKLHTGEPTDLTPEQISVAEIRDFPSDIPFPMRYPPFQPNGLPSPLPPRNPFPPLPLSFPFYMPPKANKKDDLLEGKFGSPFSSSPRSSSASSAEQQSAEDLSMKAREDEGMNETGSRSITSPTPSDFSDIEEKSQGLLKTIPPSLSDMHFRGSESPIFPHGPHIPMPPMSSAAETSKGMFPLYPPLGIFSPIRSGLDPLQAMNNCLPPFPEHPGNTTCKICFKTFACQSALEIHYRSHTKERPFKCPACDRGFSTKGNMKQHLSTHKSSEIPADANVSMSPSSGTAEDKGDSATGCSSTEDEHASLGCLEDDKNDLVGKRERDSEREGGISLPEAKRCLGSADGAQSLEEGPNKRPSEIQGQVRSFQSPPLASPSSMVLPLPPTLSIPSSISHLLPYPGRPSPSVITPSMPISFHLPMTPPKGDALNP